MTDLVGAAEIAQRLGVHPVTVHKWRRAGGFPEPLVTLKMGPVWDWTAIARWQEERTMPL